MIARQTPIEAVLDRAYTVIAVADSIDPPHHIPTLLRNAIGDLGEALLAHHMDRNPQDE